MSDFYDLKAPCRDCDGEGCSEGSDMADCEHCAGSGECDCSDCMSDAAEAAHERMCDGEPPLSADELHQIAWRQKQELRR